MLAISTIYYIVILLFIIRCVSILNDQIDCQLLAA